MEIALHDTSYDNNGIRSAVRHCLTSSIGQGDMSNFNEPLTFFNFFDGQLDGFFNSCNSLYKSSSLSLSVSCNITFKKTLYKQW